MKKALCLPVALLALCLVACSGGEGRSEVNSATAHSTTELPNPMVSQPSLEAAEKVLGTACQTPSVLPAGYRQSEIFTIDDVILEIQYEKDGSKMSYRTGPAAKNEGDISGDYNTYESVEEKSIAGETVTLRGGKSADGAWNSGFWSAGEMCYAFVSDAPLTTAEVTAMLESIG